MALDPRRLRLLSLLPLLLRKTHKSGSSADAAVFSPQWPPGHGLEEHTAVASSLSLSGVLCGGGGDGAACAQGTAGVAHAWVLVTVVYSWTQMEEHSGCSLNVAKVTPLWV